MSSTIHSITILVVVSFNDSNSIVPLDTISTTFKLPIMSVLPVSKSTENLSLTFKFFETSNVPLISVLPVSKSTENLSLIFKFFETSNVPLISVLPVS